MSLTYIQPTRHVVRETDASRLFRRLLRTDDIFTFFSVETGEWILASWVNRLGHLAEEIEDLGASMEKLQPALVEQITRCWGHVDWAKKKRMMLSRYKARETRQNESIIDQQEKWDWLRRRTKDRLPVPYMYSTPFSGGTAQ